MLSPGGMAAAIVRAIRQCNATVLRNQFLAGAPGFDRNLQAEVVLPVTIWVRGRLGGADIESAPFSFPIRVCYGCLQTGYPDASFAGFAFPHVPACGDLRSNPYLGNPCSPGQDVIILCCVPEPARPAAVECPGVPRGTATP